MTVHRGLERVLLHSDLNVQLTGHDVRGGLQVKRHPHERAAIGASKVNLLVHGSIMD